MNCKDDVEEKFIRDWNEGKVRRVSDGKRMVPEREWQGLTDEEIRNEAKNHVFDESFFSGAIWARGQIMRKNNG